ncbi:hypothetical protein ACJRO7_013947 [Eucalyptus globulus]|uniref:Uncharacterized protein n=1 Tax=Eucalyptus globulus TaxID=34317 RepID=A0ABD3KZH6_EUCGL
MANRSQSLHQSSNEAAPLTSSQPDDDYSPLGIYSHRAEEQGRNLPLHNTPLTIVNGSRILETPNDSHPCNSKFLPDLHSAGAVEDGRIHLSHRTIAAEPFASTTEDQNLRSTGSAYPAPLQHERSKKDAHHGMPRVSDHREGLPLSHDTGSIAAMPATSATEERNLKSAGSDYPAPQQHQRVIIDAQHGMHCDSEEREEETMNQRTCAIEEREAPRPRPDLTDRAPKRLLHLTLDHAPSRAATEEGFDS